MISILSLTFRVAANGVRELLADLPDAEWDVPTRILEEDVLFIEFVFADEGIRAQTLRYTLEARK
ncbi:hypothetical protein ACQP04_02885 [Pseudonocardia halophobica]|uniref:hypothetical protein n=1 Tax=Pseudonocardia halophobica TaxID=29401 RepID=UPI003D9387E5